MQRGPEDLREGPLGWKLQTWLVSPQTLQTERAAKRDVQGGPPGRGTLFVDIKLKVLPQYELLIQ